MTPEFDCQTQIDILKEQIKGLNEVRAEQNKIISELYERVDRIEELLDIANQINQGQ